METHGKPGMNKPWLSCFQGGCVSNDLQDLAMEIQQLFSGARSFMWIRWVSGSWLVNRFLGTRETRNGPWVHRVFDNSGSGLPRQAMGTPD